MSTSRTLLIALFTASALLGSPAEAGKSHAHGAGRHEGSKQPRPIETPLGIAHSVMTDEGPRHVVKQENGSWPNYTTYTKVQRKGGELQYEQIHPISTQFGATTLVEEEGRLSHKVEIEGQSHRVSMKAGTVIFHEGDKEHEHFPRRGKALILPQGRTRAMMTAEGPRDVLITTSTWYGTASKTYQAVTLKDGQVGYEVLQPISTPFGQTELVEKRDRLVQRLTLGKYAFDVLPRKDGGFDYVDEAGQVHKDAPRVRGRMLTPHGLVRSVTTPDGRQKDVVRVSQANGIDQYHTVALEKGQLHLEQLNSDWTPFGQSGLVQVGKQLLQRLVLGGHAFEVKQKDDGSFWYIDKKGVAHADAPRVEKGIATEQGVTRPMETALGRRQVLTTESYGEKQYQVLDLQTGQPRFSALSTLWTPFGQTTMVEAAGRLDQILRLGAHAFGVRYHKQDGRFEYIDSEGKVHTDAPRAGSSIVLQEGETQSMITAAGRKDILVTPPGWAGDAEHYHEVTIHNGQPQLREHGPTWTPFGQTQVSRQGETLHQRLTLGEHAFDVKQKEDGSFEYVDSAGKASDAPRVGAAIATPKGLARELMTSEGRRHVVTTQDWRGSIHEILDVTPHGIAYRQIAPLWTSFGQAEIFEEPGRIAQRITIGEHVFEVKQRQDGGFDFIDTAGKVHEGAPRIGGVLHTPGGTTKQMLTHLGRRDVLVQPPPYAGYPERYFVATILHGQVQLAELAPLQTPWGQTQLVAENGRFRQRLTIGEHSVEVKQHQDGSLEYFDKHGVGSKDLPRIGKQIITPYGLLAQPVMTSQGRQDVVEADVYGTPRPGLFSAVTFQNGVLRYTPLSPTQTPYGPARFVMNKGKLEQHVELEGKTYKVFERKGVVEIVDEQGQPYRDTFVERIKSTNKLPSAVRRIFDARSPALPEGDIVTINGYSYMSKQVYDQLRDAMVETMRKYDPRTHYFIGLGSDPHPIIAFLENLGGRELALNFPASGKYGWLEHGVLDPYVRRLIPPEVLSGQKTLVVLDQTNSGATREGTLAQIAPVFERYLQAMGSPAKVERLAYSPVRQGPGTGHIDTNQYPEVSRFLGHPYEHHTAQYDRHVLGQNTPEQLIERNEYVQFRDAIKQRMVRDEVLDHFLTNELGISAN